MPENVAVILLPGILGSPLKNKYTGDDIWPVHDVFRTAWTGSSHTAKKVKLFVDNLKNLTNVTEVVRPPRWEEGDITFVSDIYHKFVKLHPSKRIDLDGQGLAFTPKLYVLNYNWSVSTIYNLDDVRDEIRKILDASWAQKFMIVTHSMGALVAQAVVLDFELWRLDSFKGIVAVAGPCCGAPEALMRMMRGFPKGAEFMSGVVKKLLSNTGWKFSMLAPVLQGFADLLPFDDLSRDLEKEVETIMKVHFNQNTPVTRIFTREGKVLTNECSWQEAYVNLDSLIARMKASVMNAKSLHCKLRLGQNVLNEKHKMYAVALTGKRTVSSMDHVTLQGISGVDLRGKRSDTLDIPEVLGGTYKTSSGGDGTVPDWSQTWGANAYNAVGESIDHADAFKDERVWPYIHTGMNWLYKYAK